MKPEEQLKVFKEMRKSGIEMLGIYHSHYKVAAEPSLRDIELAFYPEAVYIIVSLDLKQEPGAGVFLKKENAAIRGFGITDKKISEEKIEVISKK